MERRIQEWGIARNLVSWLVIDRMVSDMAADLDPDAALMLRVRDGDIAAFEMLVDKYKQPVFNLLYRNLQDATEAEDIAQNVFVQVYRSAARYQVTARFSTWLFTIARNLSLNELRRRSRHPAESLDAGGTEVDGPPARQYEDVRSSRPYDLVLRSELEAKVDTALAASPRSSAPPWSFVVRKNCLTKTSLESWAVRFPPPSL